MSGQIRSKRSEICFPTFRNLEQVRLDGPTDMSNKIGKSGAVLAAVRISVNLLKDHPRLKGDYMFLSSLEPYWSHPCGMVLVSSGV